MIGYGQFYHNNEGFIKRKELIQCRGDVLILFILFFYISISFD